MPALIRKGKSVCRGKRRITQPNNYMSHHYVKAALAGLILAGVAGAQAQPSSPQGVITAKGYLNIGGGTAVADLTGNAKYPNNPDVVAYPGYFEWNATGDINTAPGDYADNYGSEIVGYFYPPATGDYIFYIAADDGANLYLSTDANPANKKLIAQETGWSGKRSFTTVGGCSTIEAKDSSLFTGTQWPTLDPFSGGAKITLQQGQAYYIQALEKEGGGGDGLAVAVSDPLGAHPQVARTILAAPWILGIAALAYTEHLLYVKHGWPGLLPIPATIIGVAAVVTATVWALHHADD